MAKKPSLKHFHIRGCLVEARPYMPKKRKLDSKMVNFYFVEYSEESWGYKFYDPTTKLIFELENAWFFEHIEPVGGDIVRDFVFE